MLYDWDVDFLIKAMKMFGFEVIGREECWIEFAHWGSNCIHRVCVWCDGQLDVSAEVMMFSKHFTSGIEDHYIFPDHCNSEEKFFDFVEYVFTSCARREFDAWKNFYARYQG